MSAIRQRLEARLRRPLDDSYWETLWPRFEVDWEDIALLRSRDEDTSERERAALSQMVTVCNGSRKVGATHAAEPQLSTDALEAFEVARSVYLARVVSEQDGGLQRYRSTYLPEGTLIPQEGIGEWMVEQGGVWPVADNGGGEFVRWVVPGGDRVESTTDPVSGRSQTVHYAGTSAAAVNGAPALAELATLARRLVNDYGILDEASATTFVLAGGWPYVPMLQVDRRPAPRGPWREEIVIRVHPDVPAAEVASRYRAAQQSIRPGRRPHLQTVSSSLALFAAVTSDGPKAAFERYRELHRESYGAEGPVRSRDSFARVVNRAKARALPSGGPLDFDAARAAIFRERKQRRARELRAMQS